MSSLAIKFDDHAIDVSFTKASLHFVFSYILLSLARYIRPKMVGDIADWKPS